MGRMGGCLSVNDVVESCEREQHINIVVEFVGLRYDADDDDRGDEMRPEKREINGSTHKIASPSVTATTTTEIHNVDSNLFILMALPANPF